jgi:hypothetical protein
MEKTIRVLAELLKATLAAKIISCSLVLERAGG